MLSAGTRIASCFRKTSSESARPDKVTTTWRCEWGSIIAASPPAADRPVSEKAGGASYFNFENSTYPACGSQRPAMLRLDCSNNGQDRPPLNNIVGRYSSTSAENVTFKSSEICTSSDPSLKPLSACTPSKGINNRGTCRRSRSRHWMDPPPPSGASARRRGVVISPLTAT